VFCGSGVVPLHAASEASKAAEHKTFAGRFT
jgi:hypothetical protein